MPSDWGHPRGDGPPLAPIVPASRIISGFEVEILPSFDAVEIVGGWPSMPFLIHHVTGYVNHLTGREVPSRDPVGVTPQGWELIAEATEAWLERALNP
jgi:hypothetical protein